MNAREVLLIVTQAGGRLTPDGDTLTIEAPAPLPAELMALVREHKQALLALLTPPPSDDRFPVAVLVCPHCQQAAFRYASGRVECQNPACGQPLLKRPAFTCLHCGATQAHCPGKQGATWGPAYCAACGRQEVFS